MKIPRKTLKPMVDRLLPICQRRTTLPILKHILVHTNGSLIRLQASSGEEYMALSSLVDQELATTDFCVSAQQLSRVVDAADESLELELKGSSLIVTGQGRAELQILPAVDFPANPEDKFKEIILNTADLLTCVKSVAWGLDFVRKSETDLRKMGIHILTEAKRVQAECYNGILFVRNFLPSIAADMDAIVLREFASNFIDMLSGAEVKILIGQNHLAVRSDRNSWLCKLPDVKFLSRDINQIIETGWVDLGIILPEEVLPHLMLCQSFAADDGDQIDLDFKKTGLKVLFSCEPAADAPVHYEADVPGKYGERNLRYNLRYLTESVKRLNNEGSPIKLLTKEAHLKLVADGLPTVCIAGMSRRT